MGLWIELSMIQISNHPNSIVDYDTNSISSWRSSWRSWFQCSFDLISIENDQFWYNFDLLIKIRPKKIDLKIKNINWKMEIIKMNQKSQYILTFLISLLISFQLNSISFDLFDINRTRFNRFRRDELESCFKFGSKKLI